MEPEIAKLQPAKPIVQLPIANHQCRFKGATISPLWFSPNPPCRKLFTILPTLIVNNNNNKRRRSSCAKFQNNPIQAATNKKKPRKYREKQQHQEENQRKEKLENTLLWWPSKSFALDVVAMVAIQMARLILPLPRGLWQLFNDSRTYCPPRLSFHLRKGNVSHRRVTASVCKDPLHGKYLLGKFKEVQKSVGIWA